MQVIHINKRPVHSPSWRTLISVIGIGTAALLIGALVFMNPQAAMQASLRGVSVWWDVLFPALFPFFVLSELLLGFGIVHLAGTLLDPFMRPLFRLPGVGGFILAMGSASGYPVGARLTSRLMEQKLVTRNEGERLVAMTTTSDPIFLIGAVCIGFFGSLQPAPLLAVAHYCGALLIGLISRWGSPIQPLTSATAAVKGNRMREAIAAMHRARIADGRPFGLLLQQSINTSLALMMIVGGLVVFFSAVLELFVQSGILSLFHHLTAGSLQLLGSYPDLAPSFVKGTFEVTLGAKEAAANVVIPLVHRIAAAAFVLSWAGLSVHAQVAGLMSRTGWRYFPFARARLLHGFIAMLFVYALWPLFPVAHSTSQSTYSYSLPTQTEPFFNHTSLLLVARLPLVALSILLLIIISGTLVIGIAKLRQR
jgi:sporulation integral membrane protein YlbJ